MSEKKSPEPKWITEEILAIIHARQVERFGGLHGIPDNQVVLAALNRPYNRWAYGAADIAELAAVYLVALAGTQGFNDGNKRTGLACALVFLGLNELTLDADPDELFSLTLAVSTNRISDFDVGAWIRARILTD